MKLDQNRKQKTLVSIVMAAIMLASIFVAMTGTTGARSTGGPYNTIDKQAISEPDLSIDLKVGTKSFLSIAAETDLIIDMSGMGLAVWLSKDTVARDDDFTINGNAMPNTILNLLIISPKGSGGTLINGNGQGIYNTTVTVASDGTFSKKINVGFNANIGSYAVVVLTPGTDLIYNGLTGTVGVDNFFDEAVGLPAQYNLEAKTQAQILEIIEDATVGAAGSDDLMSLCLIKVEIPYVELDPIENVIVGEPLVVTGTSNREEGFAIVITVKGPKELTPQTVVIENGTFSATFDTTDAPVGSYVVRADDGDGHIDTTTVEIIEPENYPPIAQFTCVPPNPALNETVTFNASFSFDPDGIITSYNWSFGDGNFTSATEVSVIHSYALAGEYTVNLTVIDDEGATNKTSRGIKVFPDVPYLDTEAGTYPSISGTHNGTIIMTHTVNVSKIFIYPCAGTGGHIKYAKIWNASWDGAEAHWNGYIDDWHNCSFDKNFTLVAGEMYNYTIQTGSYPQIHHTPELLTAKGWITCPDFVDVNGGRDKGWIPAIRLS